MSAPDQQRMATYFAPLLVFHRDEQFYPTEALTPFGDLSNPTREDVAGLAIDRRVRAYLAMPLLERVRFTTVYYRVSSLAGTPLRRVAIEYFFYYLFNAYSARGGIFPLRLSANHFHDFESLVIVVSWPPSSSDGAWEPADGRVVGIYPSDHGADVPDNVWRARGDEHVALPLHVIVELGSHAMAADINQDGRFDPGVDMNRPSKFVWGIRDHGATWARYNPVYMDAREPGRDIEMVGPLDGQVNRSPERVPLNYALAPAARLTDAMGLVERLAGESGFGHASWTVRLFGGIDPRTLVHVPDLPEEPQEGRGDDAAARYEHGLSVGASNLLSLISVDGGGRWLFNGPGHFPDLMLDGDVAVTNDRSVYFMVDSFASYRLDVITRLLVGVGGVARGLHASDARADLLGGVEFRVGHLRVRNLARHNTSLGRTWFDLRVSYVF